MRVLPMIARLGVDVDDDARGAQRRWGRGRDRRDRRKRLALSIAVRCHVFGVRRLIAGGVVVEVGDFAAVAVVVVGEDEILAVAEGEDGHHARRQWSRHGCCMRS